VNRRSLRSLFVAFGLASASCGSGTVTNPGGGGTAGTGGTGGGAPGTGGAPVSGSGGAPSTGGSAGGGGTMAASGGSAGTEGARDAGQGAGTGGSTGRADSGAASDGAVTAGCNAGTWPMGGTANPQTLDVTNNGTTTSRQFYFALPATYSSSRAYRVVFAWHYAGGTALIIASNGGGGGRYYGLQPLMPDTLFVTGQGLMDAQGRTGWPNTNGQDVAFARALVQWVNANFCVDTSRIMSTGFSYGAIMSHTLACQMPDVFRAVGVMSGALIGRATGCVNHPIAAWLTHGADDTAAIGGVEFTSGEAARDRLLALNHCGTTNQPVDPAPCVAYDGCDAGYPVVWCPREAPRTDTAHVIPTFAPAAISTFFSQF
jgi:polyhydroxybutyrate depolymerase